MHFFSVAGKEPANISCRLPDPLRVARALSAPQLGPRVLFFSGGSALNGIARRLKAYTHNSIHLVTPFDSGGSSQILREAFDMPAVGDLRSRLMALADETLMGQPDVYALFNHRLPKDAPPAELRATVETLLSGTHPLVTQLPEPMRQLVRAMLARFAKDASPQFDFRNASVGNLILAGGYLGNGRALDPVLFLMSRMVDARGTVRPVASENLHLGAELANGARILGQKRLSGKEASPISSPIARLFLSDGQTELARSAVSLPDRNRRLIAEADVICYPPGSLYSSVIANLLPQGVGAAIAARHVPKVYLPSLGTDPEAIGLALVGQVEALLAPLLQDAKSNAPTDVLTHVLCDLSQPRDACQEVEDRFGLPCLRAPLAAPETGGYDPDGVSKLLVSLD